MNKNKDLVKCSDCKFLGSDLLPSFDFPYIQLCCLKGKWDGCNDNDQSEELIECDEFIKKEALWNKKD
ncbi:MAG TPA: hypothetical protein VI911_12185 [Patescibacteria group bacterium]|nr:hypothetical protein [Patescibacteria group bacterium]